MDWPLSTLQSPPASSPRVGRFEDHRAKVSLRARSAVYSLTHHGRFPKFHRLTPYSCRATASLYVYPNRTSHHGEGQERRQQDRNGYLHADLKVVAPGDLDSLALKYVQPQQRGRGCL